MIRCALLSLDSTINGTGSFAGICRHAPVLYRFAALFKRQPVIGEIDERKTVAAMTKLSIELTEQIVGLRHGV